QDAARTYHGGACHQPGRAGRRDYSPHQMNMTGDRTRLGDVETIRPHEKGRRPPDQTPTPQRTHTAGHDHVERGLLAPQKPQGLDEGGPAFAPDRIEPSALRFAY